MSKDLTGRGTVGLAAIAALATLSHVSEYIAHCATVGHFTFGSLPVGTFVGVQQQNKLLLDEFSFFLFIDCSLFGKETILIFYNQFYYQFWSIYKKGYLDLTSYKVRC